ncbi:MAG TPA: winged helix-turn-helix domain-containing protein [Gammaproteobacteria bacterium]|nr:winged helix-turn-helix domain-containing protein [Gammaproteobacteria bacterium]HRP86490.1 winged helix-turn-helix domain-containing protein [Gammaproteobacteria bacterium]
MDERERYWRRVKGMLMLQTGVPQAEVARRLGVTRAAVSGWKGRLAGGETPHTLPKHRGRVPRLSHEDCRVLRELLQRESEGGRRLKLEEIGRLIAAHFSIEFSVAQVSRIAHGIGWSVQWGRLVPPRSERFRAGFRRAQQARLARLATLMNNIAVVHDGDEQLGRQDPQ